MGVYASEILITSFRGIGISLAFGIGRLGAVCSPMITALLIN